MNENEKLLIRLDYLRCIADESNAEDCERISKMSCNQIMPTR